MFIQAITIFVIIILKIIKVWLEYYKSFHNKTLLPILLQDTPLSILLSRTLFIVLPFETLLCVLSTETQILAKTITTPNTARVNTKIPNANSLEDQVLTNLFNCVYL